MRPTSPPAYCRMELPFLFTKRVSRKTRNRRRGGNRMNRSGVCRGTGPWLVRPPSRYGKSAGCLSRLAGSGRPESRAANHCKKRRYGDILSSSRARNSVPCVLAGTCVVCRSDVVFPKPPLGCHTTWQRNATRDLAAVLAPLLRPARNMACPGQRQPTTRLVHVVLRVARNVFPRRARDHFRPAHRFFRRLQVAFL